MMKNFMDRFQRRLRYAASLPERTLRSLAALAGGTTTLLTDNLFPEAVRQSTIYTVSVGMMQKFVIEKVADMAEEVPEEGPELQEAYLQRKMVGTALEAAGLMTVGLSPMWFFAIASDAVGGSKVFLQRLVARLKENEVIPVDAEITELVDALEAAQKASSQSARIVDAPPLSRADLVETIEQLKGSYGKAFSDSAKLLPEMEETWALMERLASRDNISIDRLSGIMTVDALNWGKKGVKSAVSVGQTGFDLLNDEVLASYKQTLQDASEQGLNRYIGEHFQPFWASAKSHFDAERLTWTERRFGGQDADPAEHEHGEADQMPAVPGLRFRHFAGEADYPAMLAVLIASNAADQLPKPATLEQFAANYNRLKNCGPYQDLILAEVHGELVGYVRGSWWDDRGYGRVYPISVFLRPDWRGKGVLTSLFAWVEQQIETMAASHLTGPDRYFQANASEHQGYISAHLQARGYTVFREYYDMIRPDLENLPDYPLPEGLEIRAATPEQYPAIWQSVCETSVDEWPYSPATEDDYAAWLESPHFQPDLWKIAWDTKTERVVGHVLTFIDHPENEDAGRKRGYTEGIGVDREWRRRGLAKALISLSLRVQMDAGMGESALAADGDSQSGVTRLYTSCGFQVAETDYIYRKKFG